MRHGEFQVRHGECFYDCEISEKEDRWLVELMESDQGLASGQFAVFYQNGVCLGSGVIETSSVFS